MSLNKCLDVLQNYSRCSDFYHCLVVDVVVQLFVSSVIVTAPFWTFFSMKEQVLSHHYGETVVLLTLRNHHSLPPAAPSFSLPTFLQQVNDIEPAAGTVPNRKAHKHTTTNEVHILVDFFWHVFVCVFTSETLLCSV